MYLWDSRLEELALRVLTCAVEDATGKTAFSPRAARDWLALPTDAPFGPAFWCRVAGLKPATFYRTLADTLADNTRAA